MTHNDNARRYDGLTPMQVEAEIMRMSGLLEHDTGRYAELAETAGRTEAEHKRLRARRALLVMTTTGPSGRHGSAALAEVTADADPAVSTAYLERRLAEARADACREAMRTTRTQIEAMRTLAANQRGLTQ